MITANYDYFNRFNYNAKIYTADADSKNLNHFNKKE